MEDPDGDGVTDGSTLIAGFKDGIQEHGVHALRRGPDGALTMMVGNNTFLLEEGQIDPASPFNSFRESQFLLTLGGYHPGFQRRPEYPVVPRLGFRWNLFEVVQIKGANPDNFPLPRGRRAKAGVPPAYCSIGPLRAMTT